MAPQSEAEEAGSDAASRPSEAAARDPSAALASVPCHIFLPVVPAARVIGKGGSSIRAIRERCAGADVKILQKELPMAMQRREDRIVVLRGAAGPLREAIRCVLERVFDRSGLPEAAKASGSSAASADRAHVVELVVPERSGAHFIGQRGDRIKSLIDETKCDIHVVKEPMVGLAEQKRLRVTGSSAESVAAAVWRMLEVLAELVVGGVLKQEHFELREAVASVATAAAGRTSAKEVPIRLLISGSEAAWVVGKRGNKIIRLRDLAKVHVNNADSPPFDESERVLEITSASLQHRIRVVQMVLDDLALRPERAGDLRLLLPTDQFGSLMGHKGETIRGIMQSTGANLKQHKAEKLESGGDYKLRLLELRGDVRQKVDAIRLVHETLEAPRRGSSAADTSEATAVASGLDLHRSPAAIMAPGGGTLASLGLSAAASAPAAAAYAGVSAPAPYPVSSAAPYGDPGVAKPEFQGLPAPPASAPVRRAPPAAASVLGADCGLQLTLELAMPSEEVARLIAGEASGIAWRSGSKLSAGRGPGGMPTLLVTGTAVANSVACYLIQDRMCIMH
eukprot:TRINITY_DN38525_c0_g1_i1.p1 TRINITY_DN38525_c0_g1~~TRINITY_DN38525_c0_g1_i1.p1  ORF type:complete len:566 (+),score=138.86 TRINITY_DN38525_c0_g1_i1:123-1820(+)